ncbi:MAG: protein kinase [Xenococcaceae cyanobacterium MO_188.B32]|nr:protein kinase [Xenococcaceae cyanobacterium MO_188.B32]
MQSNLNSEYNLENSETNSKINTIPINYWQEGEVFMGRKDNYKIIKNIGSGGCGIAYLAKGEWSQKLFVIKTINDNVNGSRTLKNEVLTNEFANLAGLEHPHIVKVEGYERIGDFWCLFLEHIEGQNLKKYVREKGPLSEKDALKYIQQIGSALNYLHNEEGKIYQRIIHHDIKPSNIMLRADSNQVVLIDFGAARFYREEVLGVNQQFYTPGYTPLEPWDIPATDVYALAATLYYLLTKEHPISSQARYQGKELPPPQHYNPQISDRVNDAILKGMEIESKDRPSSVLEWLELLEEIPSPLSQKKYNYTIEEKYSFTTNANGQQNTYYFVLDENNQPIELGNGNYGVVYLIHKGGNSRYPNKYAFKILYKYDDSELNEVIKERFEAEIRSSNEIIDELENFNVRQIPGIVMTIDGTTEFLDSNAYKTFTQLNSIERLSNYALVMELYDKTLEELLEDGIGKYAIQSSKLIHHKNIEPIIFKSKAQAKEYIRQKVKEKKEQKNLESKIYELNGYDLLSNLNFAERIATILPYLENITQGLRYLHKAGYLHLDLKPANIFNRELDSTLQSAIGDLGFLQKNHLKPQSLLGKYNRLPLGTLHYRSPEQKYFFDVANVEIDNDTQKRLVIRDPIFRDTIIEKGDYVIFGKHNDKSYKIERIDIELEKNAPVYIYLKSDENDEFYLKPCKRNQAKFYKIQGKRTDLFGIGAIAFNLITCGESPERFYESIRKYDTQNSTVAELIAKYESVYSFESSEPGLTKIFEPFQDKNSSEYVPRQIVELILKCMLYKAEDTFYNSSKSTNKEPTAILLEQLKSLHNY